VTSQQPCIKRYEEGTLLGCTTLFDESVSADRDEYSALYEQQVRVLVKNVIRPIVSSRSKTERQRLRGVELRILPQATDTTTAVSISGNPGKIAVSNGFIHGLHSYAETFLVEVVGGVPHFRERYFSYSL
jgi:hypothetical protein